MMWMDGTRESNKWWRNETWQSVLVSGATMWPVNYIGGGYTICTQERHRTRLFVDWDKIRSDIDSLHRRPRSSSSNHAVQKGGQRFIFFPVDFAPVLQKSFFLATNVMAMSSPHVLFYTLDNLEHLKMLKHWNFRQLCLCFRIPRYNMHVNGFKLCHHI